MTSSTAGSITTVTWRAATTLYCAKILQYYVSISYDNGTIVDTMKTESLQATFSDLDNGTVYQVIVVAGNEVGNGTVSTINVTTTDQGLLIHCTYCVLW